MAPPLETDPIYSLQRGNRRATFDTGAAVPGATPGGNAIRARFQGLVNSVPTKKNTYKHERINPDQQIRILKILHGKDDEKLQCMLFPSGLGPGTSRRATDKYYALSYCTYQGSNFLPIRECVKRNSS
jgi:hypothetical protein